MLSFNLYGQTIKFVEKGYHDSISKKTSIIDSIFNSDSICIILNSNGCFHNTTAIYIIKKEKLNYFVAYIDKNKITSKNKKINENKIQFLKDIIINGLSIDKGLCTTKNIISISDKKSSTFFIDDRCSKNDDCIDKINNLLN